MTQAALAEQAELTSQYLCLIEAGKKKVSLGALLSISQSLNVSLDEFLYGVQKPDQNDYLRELSEMLSDCDSYERRVIYDLIKNTKKSLRVNKGLEEKNDKITIFQGRSFCHMDVYFGSNFHRNINIFFNPSSIIPR